MDLSLDTGQDDSTIQKYIFNLKVNRSDGLLLQIHQTFRNKKGVIQDRRFLHSSFSDDSSLLALADHKGKVFVVDLESNRYWKLPNIGLLAAISFSKYNKGELLISLDTGVINIVNTENGTVTGFLSGHSIPATEVSYSDNGYYCLTSCTHEAIIWDLSSNTQAHRLSMTVDMIMKKVLFMPVSNHILACFEDDAMHIWRFGSFECVKQIIPESWRTHHLKTIAFTRNGRAMVIGGHTPSLVVFCLDTWVVQKVIELPVNIPGVKHLEFVPQVFDGGANKILAMLTNSCAVYFLDIETSTFLNSMRRLEGIISKFTISANGKFLSCVLNSGEVNIYSNYKILDGDRTLTPIEIERAESGLKNETEERNLSLERPKGFFNQLMRARDSLDSVQRQINDVLSIKKLRPLLKEFGEYPESYRVLIWKTILKLPHNQPSYVSLSSKECHPSFAKMEADYPLGNKSLLITLKRLLSNLAHWCPLFGEVDFLPEFVFPFVKVFHFDPFVCFEAVATVIFNWCQHWFEYFPFPPINTLAMIENALAQHDPDLLEHYYSNRVTSKMYAWTLLETAFSEVLSKTEWMKLWDHVISNEPAFLLMTVVAYNVVFRNAIMKCSEKGDFEFFFHNQNPVNVKRLIAKSYEYLKSTPDDIHPRQYLEPFRPLTRGAYNVYNEYPKFILDTWARRMHEIHQEEDEILSEQRKALAIKMDLDKKLKQKFDSRGEEQRLKKLENAYRRMVENEEERLAGQRMRLRNLRNELRLKELNVLETARETALKERTKKREDELDKLMEEISRKKSREETELDMVEEEIRKYYSDLLSHKCQLEMELGSGDAGLGEMTSELRLQQQRLRNELGNLHNETAKGFQKKRIAISNRIVTVNNMLQNAETAMAREMAERDLDENLTRNRVKVRTLEYETKGLERKVDKLLENLCDTRFQEALEKSKAVAESGNRRRQYYNSCKEKPTTPDMRTKSRTVKMLWPREMDTSGVETECSCSCSCSSPKSRPRPRSKFYVKRERESKHSRSPCRCCEDCEFCCGN